MVGIYKIENLKNHQKYIGQSIRIEKRWKDEIATAFNKNSIAYSYPLSQAIRKYGVNNFSFEVIEECSQDLLNERERYWIKFYNSFFNGYNQTLGGDSVISKPKESVLGIIKDLETTDMYHQEIADKWNVSREMVQGINTGRYWFQEDKIYPLQKQHKIKSQHKESGVVLNKQKYFCQECGAEIVSPKATYCISCANIKNRKVERPKREELLKYLISIKGNFSEASRHYGVSDNAIRKWCKAYNIPSSSKEYKK